MKKAEKRTIICKYLHEVIYKSWTWDKLTKDERKAWGLVDLTPATYGRTKKDVQIITAKLYSTFLYGVGYGNQCNWRSPNAPRF